MLVIVCLCACFVSACLLSVVPGGDDGFPWIVVYFVFAGVAAGCLVFLFHFSSSLSLSPGPVQLYDMFILYTKINKWESMGIKGSFTFISFPWQSKSVRHKRYSDYNSAAMMLDRTREKKKEKPGIVLILFYQ